MGQYYLPIRFYCALGIYWLIRENEMSGPDVLEIYTSLVSFGMVLLQESFLARLYESTESYCCHIDVGVGVTL